MRKKIRLIACGMVPIFFAQAQDSLRTTTLQEVVVSATRSEQRIIETPRSVTVIGPETLGKSLYNSVGELLSSEEGIYVVGANQTSGANQSLFMRGASSNQVVVVVDGVRITDPSSPNAAIDLSELSLTNIERIEIIRGSHSTMYGGSSIGGVVNIITKKNSVRGFHGNASAQAGTFGNKSNSLSENINVSYSIKSGWYANASLFQQNTNGLDASIRNNQPGVFSTSDKDAFRKTDGSAKVGFRNAQWDAYLSYKKTFQIADIDAGAFTDDDNNYVEFERNFWQYNLGYTINSRLKISAFGSWSDLCRINENDSSIVDEDGSTDHSYFKGNYHGKLQTHEFQLNYQTEKLKGVVGGGLYREEMFFDTYFFANSSFGPFESTVNYDSVDASAQTSYAFLQLAYNFGHFNLSTGTRFSNHSRFGNYWTFEINPSYRINTLLIYGSLSSGYNAPSLYQLFDPSKGFGSYTTRGNRNLKAEESLSLEVGIKKEFAKGVYFTVSVFETSVKNLIEYIYLWDGSKPISSIDFNDYRGDTYINVSKQQTKGVELKGYAPFLSKFFIAGNVTWLSGKAKVKPGDIDPNQVGGNHIQLYNYGSFLTSEISNDNLLRRPNVTSFAELGYNPIATVTLSAIYRYASSRFDVGYNSDLGPYGALAPIEINDYNLFDLGANWQINKNFQLGVKVENIFDEEYREIAGFQTRGRSAYIKLALKW